jgi:hypothetical protein
MTGDYMPGFQVSAQTAPAPAAAPPPAPGANTTDDGFSFADLLDIINPLQHLPIISTLYRHLTGDTIKPMEQIAGDALFGGVLGLASSIADYAFKEVTGKDVGDTVYAFVTGQDNQTTAVASAAQPATASTDRTRIATHAPTPLLGATMAEAATPPKTGSTALLAAAESRGVSPDVASRALSAYQASLLLPKIAQAAVP